MSDCEGRNAIALSEQKCVSTHDERAGTQLPELANAEWRAKAAGLTIQ